MTRARVQGRRGLGAAALVAGVALGVAPGCFSDATEVVVVVDTDMQSSEFGSLGFAVTSGSINGGASSAFFDSMTTSLPATVGVVPGDSSMVFDVTVTMWPPGVVEGGPIAPPGRSLPPGISPPVTAMPLTKRTASQVSFVSGRQRTLFLPIPRACLCNGTSCPHAQEPECRELIAPVLTGFDSSHLPRYVATTTAAAP